MSHALLYPLPECGLLQSILRESWEESLKGPLSNLIEDFGGSFVLKNCEAVHPEDVDFADAQTLAKKGKLCLRVLAQLGTLMHGACDVSVGQQLAR